jgi:hypothetical protein
LDRLTEFIRSGRYPVAIAQTEGRGARWFEYPEHIGAVMALIARLDAELHAANRSRTYIPCDPRRI